MYYIFNSSNQTLRPTKAINPKGMARAIIHKAVKEEGKMWSKKDVLAFLEEWCIHFNDISDDETTYTLDEMPELVADHLIYCSSLHIIKGKTQVNNEFTRETYHQACNFFDRILDYKANKEAKA